MHQVTENSSTGRVSVNKVWNMSELRRIDALALPLEQSVKLGMYFANAKMLVWKTKSPIARAKFIWSVLQLFASPLKRAPPLLRLKLLDLQTFAEESPPSLSLTGRLSPLPQQQSTSSSKSKSKHHKSAARNHHHDNVNRSNHAHPHRARSDPHADAAAAAAHMVDGHKPVRDNHLHFPHDHDQSPSSSSTSGFVRSDRW